MNENWVDWEIGREVRSRPVRMRKKEEEGEEGSGRSFIWIWRTTSSSALHKLGPQTQCMIFNFWPQFGTALDECQSVPQPIASRCTWGYTTFVLEFG